ncbi:MAG: ROK family protein [Planctomycetota bacterium]|jgi:glucokinase|nr:ROK family protein [Planctomycetota bacterium]
MAVIHVGIKLGRRSLRNVLVDEDGRIIFNHETPSFSERGSEVAIATMVKTVRDMAAVAGVDYDDIGAIGVGVPGPLNTKAGMIFGPPNMNGWERVPLGPRMSVMTGKPVYIENDAKAAGWAEYIYGAGRGCRNMVAIYHGSGLGGAIIMDGKLFTGKDGMAGEIGHIPISRKGRLCSCGNRGCVEAYVSPTAMVASFRKMAGKGWRSSLVGRGEAITDADLFAAARVGDPLALHIVEKTGRSLGVLAAIIMNFLNPERIVVSGSVMRFGSEFIEAMRRECHIRRFGPNISVDIVPAVLGGEASALGAAHIAVERAKNDAVAAAR